MSCGLEPGARRCACGSLALLVLALCATTAVQAQAPAQTQAESGDSPDGGEGDTPAESPIEETPSTGAPSGGESAAGAPAGSSSTGAQAAGATPPAPAAPAGPPPTRMLWLDRTHQGLYDFMWHNAMRVDRWFGSEREEADYKTIYGSIAPAVLWDRYYGIQAPFRFNVYLPLPGLNERFHAFLGRFDPSEYITEQDQPSGAFRRQYGPLSTDQTLLGIGYREPAKQGSHWEAGAGMHVTLPPDPYVKGSWVLEKGGSERGLLTLRETAFWQSSQGAGLTSRADVERIFAARWLTRWTGSATFTTRSQGVIGWSAIDVMRGFAERRAVAAELEIDGQTDAPVPLHNFGAKVAWRQGILRRWLVLELRASVGWPKDRTDQQRRISPGVGVGLEMLFGTNQFLARPVTF